MKSEKPSRIPQSPRDHVERLVKWMSTDVYEKDHIIAVALLSAVAGENIFLLGPPGTAKSLVAARLKGVFSGARSFDYLMSRFSTPDEIFGPVSISRLKEHDRYERLTAGYLPEAEVVFLDEIWKAGPSIQNTLLTAINEHTFYNGGRAVAIPMKVLIAASNELPARDEGLEALWDRFLMRMISNCIESERDFFRMLLTPERSSAPIDKELLITEEIYKSWQDGSAAVTLSDAAREAVSFVRGRMKQLEQDDGNRSRFYISDRRWRKAFRLMQTSAFLNGRSSIDLTDFFLLIHAFWNDVDAIPAVIDTFSEGLTAGLRNALHDIELNIRRSMKADNTASTSPSVRKAATDNPTPRIYDYFYYMLAGHSAGEVYFSKWDYTTLSGDPRRGVLYRDAVRQRMMLRALTPGLEFDAKSQNATDIREVNIKRSPAGVYIDNIHYPFVTADGAETTAQSTAGRASKIMDMPVYQRVEVLEESLGNLTADWQSTLDSFRACNNIFLSKADYQLIAKATKECDGLIKTVAVKLKNLRSML